MYTLLSSVLLCSPPSRNKRDLGGVARCPHINAESKVAGFDQQLSVEAGEREVSFRQGKLDAGGLASPEIDLREGLEQLDLLFDRSVLVVHKDEDGVLPVHGSVVRDVHINVDHKVGVGDAVHLGIARKVVVDEPRVRESVSVFPLRAHNNVEGRLAPIPDRDGIDITGVGQRQSSTWVQLPYEDLN